MPGIEHWLKEHVRYRLLTDAAGAGVRALFASRGVTDLTDALYPKLPETGVEWDFDEHTPPPYLVLRENAIANPADVRRGGFQFWVYDDPAYDDYEFIREVERELVALYHYWRVPTSAPGYTQWVFSDWVSSSNETVDEDVQKKMKIVRFRCFGG